jgi:hypothetical protein
MDGFGVVTELLYAGLDTIEFRNLSQLPGRHEAYLNSAVHAFKKGYVTDWTDFFRETWTTALYTDSFTSLITALRVSLPSDKGAILLLSRVFERAEITIEDADVSDYRRGLTGAHGEALTELTFKTIESTTTDFMRENADFLPKFYVHNHK